jgi:hypothetical protein
MRPLLANHLVAIVGMDFNRHRVAHCAGGQKEASFSLKYFRGALLKAIYGRVLAINVICNFRSAMASRIANVGWVNVSLRRSTTESIIPIILPVVRSVAGRPELIRAAPILNFI